MKALLSILLLFFAYGAAFACSCAQPDEARETEAIRRSSTIFRGKVISVGQSGRDYDVDVKFQAQKIWKGASSAEIVVATAKESASCGYSFRENETYTVYATGNPPSTMSCLMIMVNQKRLEETLGAGTVVEEEEPPPSKKPESLWTWVWRKITSVFS